LDLNELKELLQILEEKEISEFELEESGLKLRIRKTAATHNQTTAPAAAGAPVAPRSPEAAPPPAAAKPAPPTQTPAEEEGLVVVKSPIVGTFYRAADPNSPAFVNVGDIVSLGQKLCIIEAMKLMNEIESEVAGEVVKVHPENAQPIQYGEPLFSIRPSR
jgi:acetyl-CoA carboxylase biotin carboxyl carrier protein